MAMITCPNCGEQISDKAKSCVHCGASLQPEEKRVCEECGTELEEGMEVCPVCGCPIAQSGGVTMDTPQQVEVTGVRMTKKMKKIALIEELLEKLKSSNEIAAVKNIKLESDTLKLRLLDEIEDYERSHQPTEPSGEKHPGKDPEAEGGTSETPMPKSPAAPKKKRKNVSISSVAGARTYSLENEQDIDRFLAEMKAKLMEELEDDTIITLS